MGETWVKIVQNYVRDVINGRPTPYENFLETQDLTLWTSKRTNLPIRANCYSLVDCKIRFRGKIEADIFPPLFNAFLPSNLSKEHFIM